MKHIFNNQPYNALTSNALCIKHNHVLITQDVQLQKRFLDLNQLALANDWRLIKYKHNHRFKFHEGKLTKWCGNKKYINFEQWDITRHEISYAVQEWTYGIICVTFGLTISMTWFGVVNREIVTWHLLYRYTLSTPPQWL